MRFGKKLQKSIYEPWKSNYLDYSSLKHLLREDDFEYEDREWTEDDEGKFVEELVNVQLEKVNAFQVKTYKELRDRTSECEAKLETLEEKENSGEVSADADADEGLELERDSPEDHRLDEILQTLDGVSKEISQLERFSRINYTGFLKAAKKHDRKRGSKYRVRPLLQVRLAALPFNSEDYSPLIYRFVMSSQGFTYVSMQAI